MADGATTLLYRFLGIDAGAGAQFDRMAGKTALLGDSSKTALSKIKMLAAGAGVAGAVIAVASVKMATDYQRSMTLIQTQAGATAAEVKSFSKALLDMAGQVAQSPEALATSLYHVYSTGLRGAAALDAVRTAAMGAKIGNADLEETTNALTSTIASGIKGTRNYSQAMGTLVAIVGSGDMKMSDLNEALGTGVLAAARVFNVSLREAGAVLATFGDNNIRGADAATKLRMTMQDIARPAAHADEVLSKIGITSAKLRDDLEKRGLTSALQDLKTHMDAAGITAGKVGPFIENAFTKKAGVGLAILIEQMGRYEQKLQAGQAGAAGFGSAWEATTHTAAFAFDRLKAEAESAMITLGLHLLPAVTSVAGWLGTHIPSAVARLQQVLKPLEQLVAGALTTAWKGLGAALHVVGAVLSTVASVLASNRAAFTTVAVAVLGMWLAFKGYMIARAAVKAVSDAIFMMRLRASVAADGVRNLGTSISSMSLAASLGRLALLGVGVALAGLTYQWQQNQKSAAELKATTEQYYGLLQQTKGAINDVVIAQVTQNLATDGAYAAARKHGIALRTVTQAALGNAVAQRRLGQATNGNYDALTRVTFRTRQQSVALGDAAQQYKLASGQAKDNSTATNKNSAAQARAAAIAAAVAAAIKKLRDSLQSLINTEISQMQTEDGFREGLLQLKKQVTDSGHSLSMHTQAGLANRDMLLSVLSSAEKAAEGSKNYGKTLADNIKQFIAFATRAGFSKDAVDRLLTRMHLMPKQIKTRLSLDTSGVTSGLNSAVGQAAQAGADMANAMNANFKRINGIKSPSRLYRQYGIWIVQGLIAGVKTYSARARSVAAELAAGFVTGWKDGTASLKDALTTPAQRALERLTTVVQNAIKKQADLLKASRSNLKSLLQQRAQDIASLASTVSSGADLSGLFGSNASGAPETANVNTFLSARAKEIENFAKDLKWGAQHGLSPLLLQEIAGLGAVQGDEVLQQFKSGAASIMAANRSEATIQTYATGAAAVAEDAAYAKRVAKDRKAVHDNTVELRNLTKALRSIERQTAKAASMHLTIDAKTGRPVVDKRFIEDILRGIRRAERVAGRKLL